jgi:ribosomal protein L18E
MISKRKVDKRSKNKTNTELVETISLAKKNNLLAIAKLISVPTRNQAKINLRTINASKSEEVLIPGKVLSLGEISSSKKVYALSFSEKAKEKLQNSKTEFKTILKALEDNPKLNPEILKQE